MSAAAPVLLVHGWGYGARLWDAVRERLSPALRVETVDLGYCGAPVAVPSASTFQGPVLAVGHSLGALWLLTQPGLPWRRLLCINGFPRFTAAPGYPGVAPRVLERMRKQFERDPAAVLADFRARCGDAAAVAEPDTARLADGLAQLDALDGRAMLAARRADVWALAGNDDPIVPRAMSEAAFAVLPAGQYECIAAPGHLLPLTHPDLCAQWITRLAA